MNKLFAKCLERGLSIVSAIDQTILTRINSTLFFIQAVLVNGMTHRKG